MYNNYKIISFLAVFFLASCGGGGGGDASDSSALFSAGSRIEIKATNSDEVLAEGTGSLTTSSVGGAAARGGDITNKTNNHIINMISSIRQSTSNTTNRSARTGSETNNCVTSGTQIIEYDTAASTFSASFDQCVEYGETMNGAITGSVTAGANDDVMHLSLTFTSFSVSSSDYSMMSSGTMNVTETTYGAYDESVITSSNLVISMTYEGRQLSLGNMTSTYRDYWAAGYDTYDFSLDMNSQALAGSIHVQSTATIYQSYFDDFPYAGEFKVMGANNSTILVTIDNATSITVKVDTDGDGTYESSTTDTWSNLESYLN